jgi:hypothetical protein
MRISHRPRAQTIIGTFLLLVSAGLGLGATTPARAQVLAQKNWAGSGVTVEPWWRRAVFYRVDPARFQDSNGDGRGDLAGLTQRLDYLQMLGVDALILRASPVATGARDRESNTTGIGTSRIPLDGFDDLARAAVGSHVRVIVEMEAPASQGSDALYLAEARQWLNQGAAGIYVPTKEVEKVDGAGHIVMLLQQLRQLTDSFPGERVLLADAPAVADVVLLNALEDETQLTASAPLATTTPTAASLRTQLIADLGSAPAASESDVAETHAASPAHATSAPARTAAEKPPAKTGTRHAASTRRHRSAVRHALGPAKRRTSSAISNPLLLAASIPVSMEPAQKAAVERTLAVMLLVSRGAVLLEYGQELGLDRTANGQEPLMQWSPGNVTRKPEPPKPEPPARSSSTYESFYPYIKPLPRNLFPPPVMPVVVESDEPQAVAVDPDSVPGFTAGAPNLALTATNGVTANVVLEQYDSRSLLSLYRQLIQMHHENATVRNGSETVLDRDSEDVLVWVRRPPANSRTSTSVVAACNLSQTAVGLGDVGVRGLRTLVSSPAGGDGAMLGKGMVWVGEGR